MSTPYCDGPLVASGDTLTSGPRNWPGNRVLAVARHVDGAHADANASELARRWNAHAGLVEALQKAMVALTEPMSSRDERYPAAVEAARSALAGLGGE